MKGILALASGLLVALAMTLGCSDTQSRSKQVETKEGPGGSVKTTVEKKVETKGDNPPPAKP